MRIQPLPSWAEGMVSLQGVKTAFPPCRLQKRVFNSTLKRYERILILFLSLLPWLQPKQTSWRCSVPALWHSRSLLKPKDQAVGSHNPASRSRLDRADKTIKKSLLVFKLLLTCVFLIKKKKRQIMRRTHFRLPSPPCPLTLHGRQVTFCHYTYGCVCLTPSRTSLFWNAF